MLKLEEAIIHAEEKAVEQSAKAKTIESNPWGEKSKVRSKIQDCLNCAEEHRQLASWLRELQERLKQPEIIRCKDCKNSEHWYGDRRRCFLWSEDGVSVFDDGFCNYAERRTE